MKRDLTGYLNPFPGIFFWNVTKNICDSGPAFAKNEPDRYP